MEAHDVALTFGGLPGIRDVALIESAIGRPYTGYYPRLHQKAAALAESLVRNHGFIDGNKRTAFIILFLFVLRSGYRFKPGSSEELEDLIVRVADLRPPQDELVAWFKARLIRA